MPRKTCLPEAPLLEASVLSTVSTSHRNTNLSERINKNECPKDHDFADALVQMAVCNKFQDGVSLELASILPNYTNESKLRHCLAAADFVADLKDVAVLQTEKDTGQLRSATSQILTALCSQLNKCKIVHIKAAGRKLGQLGQLFLACPNKLWRIEIGSRRHNIKATRNS